MIVDKTTPHEVFETYRDQQRLVIAERQIEAIPPDIFLAPDTWEELSAEQRSYFTTMAWKFNLVVGEMSNEEEKA